MLKARSNINPFFINGERAMISLGPLNEDVHCPFRCAFCYVQDEFSSYACLEIGKIIEFLRDHEGEYNIIYVSGDTDSFAQPRTQKGIDLLYAIVKEVNCDLEFSSRAIFSDEDYAQFKIIIDKQKAKGYRFYAGVSITRYSENTQYLEPYPIPSPDARIAHIKTMKKLGAITMLGLRPFLPVVSIDDYITILDKLQPDLDIALGECFYFIRDGKIQSRVFPNGISCEIEQDIVRNQIMDFDDNKSQWDIWNSEKYERAVAEHCEKLGIIFSMHSAEAIKKYKKMKCELKLIIATDAECSELAKYNKALIDCGGSINSMSVEELEMRMHDFIANGFIAFIFEVQNIHVGYALIDKDRKPIFIRHFFIAENFRRQGYGAKAFNKIVDFFSVDKAELTVLCSNEIGNKFWIECGFIPYETVMHYRK